MENFADFLPFSEEIQEAFDNYHIEAGSLTIKAMPKNMGAVIGRVVWRSPLLKAGVNKDTELIHFTLMDADYAEVTGTAWGLIAQRFHEILEKDKIYKFPNAVPISKTVHKAVMNDNFESRILNQSIELRFSSVVDPELVKQNPYPDIDQSQFRSDYQSIKVGQVTALVGLVTAQFTHGGKIYVCLSSGDTECVGIAFSQEKLQELKEMLIKPRYTVLGVLGVGKTEDVDTKTTGDKIPKALFKTFNDSLFIIEPQCEATQNLVTWRNEHPLSEAELQHGKLADQ